MTPRPREVQPGSHPSAGCSDRSSPSPCWGDPGRWEEKGAGLGSALERCGQRSRSSYARHAAISPRAGGAGRTSEFLRRGRGCERRPVLRAGRARGGSSGRAAPSHGIPEEELCFFHVPKATGLGSGVPARAGPGPTAAFLRCSGLPSPLSRCSCPGGGSSRKARTAGAAASPKALGRQLSPGAGCVWEQSSGTDSQLGAGQAEPILSPPGRQG